MAKTIQFRMTYNQPGGSNPINLIKVIREATNSSLMGAKKLADEAKSGIIGGSRVSMTAEQYGLFIAAILRDPVVGLNDVRMTDVHVVDSEQPGMFDFARGRV